MDISPRQNLANKIYSGSRVAWVLAAAGALLVLLTPLFMGIWIEKTIRDQIVALNQSSPLTVSINYYQRGWLNSKMFSRVALPTLGLKVDLLHDIQHGPINFNFTAMDAPGVLFASVSSQLFPHERKSRNGKTTAARIISHVSFDGDISSAAIPFSYKPFVYDTADFLIQTGTIIAQGRNRAQSSSVGAWAQINSARIVANNFESEIDDLIIRTNRQRRQNGAIFEVYGELGEANYRSGKSQLQFSDNWLHATVFTEDAGSNIRVTGSTSKLGWRESSVADLKYDLAVRNLPLADSGWPELALVLSQLFTNNFSKADSETSYAVGERLLPSLPPGLEFEISNLEFSHADRKVKVWLRASMPVLPNAHQSLDPAAFLQAITLQIEIVADESIIFDLLESRTREVFNRNEAFGQMVTYSDDEVAPLIEGSVASQLNVLRRQRYLDYENGFYSTKVSMHNGRLSINGKPLMLRHFVR